MIGNGILKRKLYVNHKILLQNEKKKTTLDHSPTLANDKCGMTEMKRDK